MKNEVHCVSTLQPRDPKSRNHKLTGMLQAMLGKQKEKSVRTTVGMPLSHYEEILRVADQKRVSVAWVIRDAIERYLDSSNSLFGGADEDDG
jgi:hypothetical protein